ncbi:MAG: Penicillin-binding protein 2 [Parcubacteria group bacterium Gr01-1014_48]|nr:MAG: Penicillin-binding protein 2 [Parcubacteria group bacterium Greene0416_14]TSC73608.1 MAG: Penicillin-binding protein 2 [Parcubacteria group bacterium Gr01-1014_48]TSD00982.1 MAG: Penicillin-binding protein 2 [Parcubacteria group bacterium Greene1014_15]TSD08122.1 MAG: Penicillin-binding protein 2 [Parcubacteria group bacterium Greene0714_4]
MRFRWRFFGGRKKQDIALDEIFLDSSNLSGLNTDQFEGHLEKPISKYSIFTLAIAFLVVGLIILVKSFILQIEEGEVYAILSEKNRLRHHPIFAERGVMYDRKENEIGWNVIHEDEDFFSRKYIDAPGLSQLIGYVSYPKRDTSGVYYEMEISGTAGAEKVFNTLLAGESGMQIIETDALQRIQSASVLRKPISGTNLHLSIDADVQKKLYAVMDDLAGRVGFDAGAAVIMDVKTGELLSLVSYPEFSSNVLASASNTAAITEYQNDRRKPFLNRAVSGLYTPGSIMKPFFALAALNEGIITPTKQILSTGSISIQNPYDPDKSTIFLDWKEHGLVDMRRALAMSSNVYFYEIGGGYKDQKGLGITKIEEYARLFGFGKEVGIGIAPELPGVIPSPAWKAENFEDKTWRLGDTYNTAIGQYGWEVSPLQVVRAFAAVANNGKLLLPQLLKMPLGFQAPGVELAIPQEHFKVVQEGMRAVVTEGTGQGLSFPNIHVAGKTGTAQIGISKKYVNSWAVGFFPYEHPRYAFAVVMEHGPVENLTGGVFVMNQLLAWMQIYTPEYLQ